jgi:hypothetical protein
MPHVVPPPWLVLHEGIANPGNRSLSSAEPAAAARRRAPAFPICHGLTALVRRPCGWAALLRRRPAHYTHTRERSDSRRAGRGGSEDHHAGPVDPGAGGGVRGRGRPRRDRPHLHGRRGGPAVPPPVRPPPGGRDGRLQRRRKPRGGRPGQRQRPRPRRPGRRPRPRPHRPRLPRRPRRHPPRHPNPLTPAPRALHALAYPTRDLPPARAPAPTPPTSCHLRHRPQ